MWGASSGVAAYRGLNTCLYYFGGVPYYNYLYYFGGVPYYNYLYYFGGFRIIITYTILGGSLFSLPILLWGFRIIL